jgi:hypothetical protein
MVWKCNRGGTPAVLPSASSDEWLGDTVAFGCSVSPFRILQRPNIWAADPDRVDAVPVSPNSPGGG